MMTQRPPFVPQARKEIADPGLLRPDWTRESGRHPGLLWLDKNENTDPALQTVVFRVLAEIDPRSVTVYPDPEPLYRTLAAYLNVTSDALVLAQGSDGIIGSVFRAFIAPGDSVLLMNPTYAMYEVYCRMHGADVTRIAYEATADGPQASADDVIKTIQSRRPKLVCLPNPDSPTGTVFEPDVLRRIVQSALEVGALMLVDEAYHPFYPQTTVPWISEYPNLVVARTFSKAWGLTGLRLGYGVTTRTIASLLQKVRPNYEVNQIAVAIAMRMIVDFEQEMQASVERLNRGRDGFQAAMRDLGFRTFPVHGSFCHVAFGPQADRVHAALREVVLYRHDFDSPSLKGFSRFSATTTEFFAGVIACIRNAAGRPV